MTGTSKSRAVRGATPASSSARRIGPLSLRALAVVVGVAAVATVAVVLGFGGGGGKASAPNVPAVGTLRDGLPGAADVNALFAGIAQQGTTLGRASAPVTLTEYVDLQCPYCKEIETQVLPDIISRYVRTGKAKLVLRPLAFTGPDAVRGRNATLAAARQNRAFNFADLLYVNQGDENSGWLDDALVTAAAASIPGLHVQALLDARNGAEIARLASREDALAAQDHVQATPTFVVGSSFGGTRTSLVAPTESALVTAVDKLLNP